MKRMPRERVLTETDGPFVKTGGRPCRPADCAEALRGLSAAWAVSTEDAMRSVAENFQRALAVTR